MKRITFQQLIVASKNLKGQDFNLFITCPKRLLQTNYTEKINVNITTSSQMKQNRIISIMARYSKGFKKAKLYVNDIDYIKYF